MYVIWQQIIWPILAMKFMTHTEDRRDYSNILNINKKRSPYEFSVWDLAMNSKY